jgi:putative DNA primase/helicase
VAPGASVYTGPAAEDLDRIPSELKARPQWVLWRGEDRIDQQTGEVKLNKIPIDPQTLYNADTTAPLTWGTFTQCVAALPVALEEWEAHDPSGYRGGGLGFVFADTDPFCGIDLDGCVDPTTGTIMAWAQAHVDRLASYTEITPSGTGLHTLVEGTLPPRGRKRRQVEMYSYARFFTMTGRHVAGTPRGIEVRQDALTTFHAAIFGQPTKAHPRKPAATVTLADATLLAQAKAASNGARFASLLAGDCTGYPSQSEADLSLCVRLAFWTQDPAQIDRLFRQSALMREKWDAPRGAQTYGARTIAEALARQTEHYDPDRPAAGAFRPLATRLASRLATTVRSTL